MELIPIFNINNMENIKYLIILIFLIITVPLSAQKYDHSKDKELIILKDSLWLNGKYWKRANLFHNFQIDSINAKETKFISVTAYRLNKNARNYNLGIDFKTLINLDTIKVGGFIFQKREAIGYLTGIKIKGRWVLNDIQMFTNQDPIKRAFELVPSKKKNDIFEIGTMGFGSLCYSSNDSIYIFDGYSRKFTTIEKFIRQRIGLDNFRNMSFGGILN